MNGSHTIDLHIHSRYSEDGEYTPADLLRMGVNGLDMRQSNVRAVLWTLHGRKTATIKELAQRTGLSLATVGTILGGLVESGEALPGEMAASTGGRRSQAYAFNPEYAHALAVSLRVKDGQHFLRACVGNLYGDVVRETESRFDEIRLSAFEGVVDACLRADPRIRVAAFSLPGVERNGVVVSNDYTALEGCSFPGHFRLAFSLPALLDNDVNAAVMGYARREVADGILAGVYFPKYFTPGAGIMINGALLKGAGGYAGEVRLLPLDIDWTAIDYQNPKEAAPPIVRLLRAVCAVINPDRTVLYGDFFTDSLQDLIRKSFAAQVAPDALPSLRFQSDLDADIVSGLLWRAISAYRAGLPTYA